MASLWQRMIVTLVVIAALALAVLGTADRAGFDYTEQGLRRALVTFAVARSLNGVISVAQGTEVAVEPAGVGVNFAPGQILDPINDLIEQFSWVMLASATSLGLQRLLIEVFATPFFTYGLALVGGALLTSLWWPRWRDARVTTLAMRLTLLLVLVRFAVPLAAMVSEGVYALFLAERYEASTQAIEQAATRIGNVNGATARNVEPPPSSVSDVLKHWYRSAVAVADVPAYMKRYEEAAADVSEQVVNLVVVFVVQTIALPLLFLWLLLKSAQRLLRPTPFQWAPETR